MSSKFYIEKFRSILTKSGKLPPIIERPDFIKRHDLSDALQAVKQDYPDKSISESLYILLKEESKGCKLCQSPHYF